MQACSIAVTVEGERVGEPPPSRRPGEPVRGVVTVTVTKSMTCDELAVGFELLATQRGYSLPKSEQRVGLFRGNWAAGEHTYPFELQTPALATREGPLMGWRWVVAATAQVAGDPRGESEVRVVPPEGPAPPLHVSVAPSEGETDDVAEQADLLWASKLLTVVCLLVSAIGFGLSWADIVGGTLGAVISYGGLVGAGIFAVRAIADRAALRKLSRRPTVELRWVPNGGDQGASLRCQVRSPFDGVEKLQARLQVKERIHWRQNKGGYDQYITHENEAIVAETQAALELDGANGMWSGSLPLPAVGAEVPPQNLLDDQKRGLWWVLTLSSKRRGEKPIVNELPLDVRAARGL